MMSLSLSRDDSQGWSAILLFRFACRTGELHEDRSAESVWKVYVSRSIFLFLLMHAVVHFNSLLLWVVVMKLPTLLNTPEEFAVLPGLCLKSYKKHKSKYVLTVTKFLDFFVPFLSNLGNQNLVDEIQEHKCFYFKRKYKSPPLGPLGGDRWIGVRL